MASVTAGAASHSPSFSSGEGERSSRSSSLDSTRAAHAAYAYDSASIALVPGLVVPLVPPAKGGCAALAGAVFALGQLADAVDTVCARVDRSTAERLRRLKSVQTRIAVCVESITRLRHRRASTLLESKPRYPQLAPTRARGGKSKQSHVTSVVDPRAFATAAAMSVMCAPSAVYTTHSDHYLRPRRSSPLPAVAPSSCSSSEDEDSDEEDVSGSASTRLVPRSAYQSPLRSITPVSTTAAATAAAQARGRRRQRGVSDHAPPPPMNPMSTMDLAASMPLESVLWDGDDASGAAVLMGDSVATNSTAPSATASTAGTMPFWQPRTLPVMRGGQVLHAACEVPSSVSALVSFPARRAAYRHLAAPPPATFPMRLVKGSAVPPVAGGQHQRTAAHTDPYGGQRDVGGRTVVNLQHDFISQSQAQQYAFVPGGSGAAASAQALMADLPRNLPLQHLSAVRQWDRREFAQQQQQHRRQAGREHERVGEAYATHDGSSSRRGSRGYYDGLEGNDGFGRGDGRRDRGVESIAPSQQQRQQQRRLYAQQQGGKQRRHTSRFSGDSDDVDSLQGSDAAESDDMGRSPVQRLAAPPRTNGRGGKGKAGERGPDKAPAQEPPGLPPSSSTAPPPPPFDGPPGVMRSTTAPPPPPLPPAALLSGRPNPPMLPSRGTVTASDRGSGEPPRLPPPPPPPPPPSSPSAFASELKSAVSGRPTLPPPQHAQRKALPVTPPAKLPPPPPPPQRPGGGLPPPPPPPPPPSSSSVAAAVQPPLGVRPGGSGVRSSLPPPPPPPPPPPGGLSTVLGQRRRVLQGDVSSDSTSDVSSEGESGHEGPVRVAPMAGPGGKKAPAGAPARPPLLDGDSSSDDSDWSR